MRGPPDPRRLAALDVRRAGLVAVPGVRGQAAGHERRRLGGLGDQSHRRRHEGRADARPFKSSGAYVVNTYNLTGYRPLSAASTPITFEATELAADEGAHGKVRLYGTLQLPKGMEAVNHIWQVGSTVANGVPAKHAFAQENLEAKGSLVLTGAGATEAAPAPVFISHDYLD